MSKAQQQREIANAFKVWSEGTPLTFERVRIQPTPNNSDKF